MAFGQAIVKRKVTQPNKSMPDNELRRVYAEWLNGALNSGSFKGNQSALSRASGVSRETIWRLLTGQRDAEARTIAALAQALQVAPPRFGGAGAVREARAFYDASGGGESQLTEDEALALLAESRPRFVRYLQARFGDRPVSKAAKLDHLEFILRLARERHVAVSGEFVQAVRALIDQGGL